MKIIYIFDEDGKYGGPRAGMELILSLKSKYNITPIVLTSVRNEINDICDKNNIENYTTGHHKYTYTKSSSVLKNCIKFLPRYVRYVLGNKKALSFVEKRIDYKSVDIIHANISGIDIGALIGVKYNIPNIMHIREYGEGENHFMVKSYRRRYIDFLNKNVTKFIAISNTVGKYWIDKGIDKNKVINIYDGLSSRDIKPRKRQNGEKYYKIIMLGSIHRGKGQEELVNAINLLDKSEQELIMVDIVGSGFPEEVNRINKIIRKYNLEHIIKVKDYDSNIRNKLCEYDIGVNCSFAEGFGRVTVEYMAAGLCVIASNKGANTEIIKNNYNGYIYKKDNPSDLAAIISKIINNKCNISNITKNCIETSKKYDVDKISKDVYSLYNELINNKWKGR